MIVELPNKPIFGNQTKMERGILKIDANVGWQSFTTKTTICNKGRNCWYCGKKLKPKEITMDHLYPQDLGGPTIPNNLVPCCLDCNSKKGNLTEKQFRAILRAPEKKKKLIKSKFLQTNNNYKIKTGYYLPKQWLTTRKINTVLATMTIGESYIGKRYSKIETFYKEFGHLQHPIIVDRKNYLIDGFLVLIFAKNHNIEKVPAIYLENIEIIF